MDATNSTVAYGCRNCCRALLANTRRLQAHIPLPQKLRHALLRIFFEKVTPVRPQLNKTELNLCRRGTTRRRFPGCAMWGGKAISNRAKQPGAPSPRSRVRPCPCAHENLSFHRKTLPGVVSHLPARNFITTSVRGTRSGQPIAKIIRARSTIRAREFARECPKCNRGEPGSIDWRERLFKIASAGVISLFQSTRVEPFLARSHTKIATLSCNHDPVGLCGID